MDENNWNDGILKKLVTKKLIRQEDLPLVLDEKNKAKKSQIEIAIDLKLIDAQAAMLFLSDEFKCPPVNPNLFKIAEEVIQMIPPTFVNKHKVMPISVYDNSLTVAMEIPNDLAIIDDLKAITNMRIRPVVALAGEIQKAIQKYYPASDVDILPHQEETIEDLIRIVQETKNQEEEVKTLDLLRQAQETPVIKVANALLVDAIKRKASDLFIEPWETSLRVRCRVDGILEELKSPPKAIGSALVSRFKVMSQLDIAERRVPQDGRFKVKIQNHEVDVRVSILPTCFGEKVCLRILDKKSQAHNLDKLGFSAKELGELKSCAFKPNGMILVTGPTGSGKTTTLYSVLKHIDSIEKNITTVEDPVEYQMDGANQVNIREQIGLTFPGALRSILRQDPDIILIGEIRDQTTIDIAIKAALTGHLVLSTLHTNDATSSIIRIINMGVEPFLITSSILMVTAQRLIRRLCPVCKVPKPLDEETAKRFKINIKEHPTLYHPEGCAKCRSLGFAGRTVITEILVLTPEIKELILKSANAEDIKKAARRKGMTTLRESGIQRVLAGETSLDEVVRVTAGDQEIEILER
ncbi:MAG: hypothetical protein A3G33_07300 [Omnitrophica bacterium RIFCSPLOWO2_12_FULL_44_17]|uniref:Bacterial type II secretion system protein E domain-containing protein n=1 Tax=Candidatus Danuiimicrobium aquiferis TaxID=1801832 RepID=A0A1G1KYW4_9BACT|nr:MAG: hypothetical protein A3B72_07600 [Omnitrophica bacterium RIFCSPHIGHO2_02_FULL_45_28]OGW89233.1 MAG: hypothetical protein A3E74_08275 [Omnitrophica bacterium RIFCSPHIGHO2_12_FULL_44_12]OGW98032.1 MAG: hypothetical protein A3G33_07300 [Omnitrophica bacterium RIFCSPLOWO2_12_FULL_44_17]